MDNFLWRELFVPLGVREAAWSKCPLGHPIGATGLYIRARDISRIGALYACGGTCFGKRFLSEKWIEEATRGRCVFSPSANGKYWSKGGMYGQIITFSAETGLSVSWHGYKADNAPLLKYLHEF